MKATTGIHMPNTLVFVSNEDHYSVYRSKRDGSEIFLAHGTGQMLVESVYELDIRALWQAFLVDNSRYAVDHFLDQVRTLIIEPEEVDEIGFCADCFMAEWNDELSGTAGGHAVCESCLRPYRACEDCEELYRHLTNTLHSTAVCEGCIDNNWSWCDNCDGYYRDGDSGEHDHERDGCCESPAQSFTIRNDGEPPLANDVRTTITLPGGVISDEGLGEICQFLRDHAYFHVEEEEDKRTWRVLANSLSVLGEAWQTKQGNYTKRLSRLAYKDYGIKLPPEVVSKVGCIASDHSQPIDFEIAVTRDLNQEPEHFAHSGSCWWTDHYESRCALKSSGGFALRTFTPNASAWTEVTGRAWVMPLRMDGTRLVPTFETLTPDAFVVFNGYGDLGGYIGSRIISHMVGMTYRKVGFECEPMYINSDSGYLVAPEEIATNYTDGHLTLSTSQHSNLFTSEGILTNA